MRVGTCFDLDMDTGMNRQEAESLAEAVRNVSQNPVYVVTEEGYFAIEVRVPRRDGQDTFTLRDESDWVWLRERIGRLD